MNELHKRLKALHTLGKAYVVFKQGTQCLDTLRSHHRRNHCRHPV